MLDAAKVKTAAELIEGRVVVGEAPVAVMIRGMVLGFPALFQAIYEGWPFGVTYVIETRVIDDSSRIANKYDLVINIMHRNARGPLRSVMRLLLMESRGVAVGDKRIQEKYLINCNNNEQADRFLRYPGVYDALLKLEEMTKFTEIQVKANAGLSLSQPKSFNSLDLDVYLETFRALSELGQILFESF
ncbi:MAG: hypothetical protein P4L53_02195 [Candidatus Obscuribacterales bacterium]|nr:hypothetical protein [Candidatus Obscuribacterales bacterium]